MVAGSFKFCALYLMVTSEPACTEVGVEVNPRLFDWAAAIAENAAKATEVKKRILDDLPLSTREGGTED